jgi:hypothetical protein
MNRHPRSFCVSSLLNFLSSCENPRIFGGLGAVHFLQGFGQITVVSQNHGSNGLSDGYF